MRHGNIAPNRKVPNVRTDNGWISMNGKSVDVERIIESAKPGANVLPAYDPGLEQPFLDESKDSARIEEREKARQKLLSQAKEIVET